MGNLTIGTYMSADRFFDEVEINNCQERIRILNGCPLQWIKQYNIKIVKDGLRKDNNYIEIVDIMDEEVEEITYTLKELVDEIQPILKEQVLVLQITRIGRRYKIYTLEYEEVESLDKMYIDDVNIIYIDGYNDCGAFTKQAIKNTIKLMFEDRKMYKEEQENEELKELENKILDIKNQFAKLGYEIIKLENEDYILRKHGSIIENYEDVEHYNIEQLENKLG